MKLIKTNKEDGFCRPIYKGVENGSVNWDGFVDVDMDDENPSICTRDKKSGEPEYPVPTYRCQICKHLFVGEGHTIHDFGKNEKFCERCEDTIKKLFK